MLHINYALIFKKYKIPILMVTPSVIITIFMVFYPTFYSLELSFFKWNGINPTKRFVGLKNYYHLFSDKILLKSIINTFYFVFITMIVQSGISLVLAVFIELEKNMFIKTTIRLIIFFPSLIAVSITGLIWTYVYSYDGGLLNNLFHTSIFWLSNKKLVIPAIIVANIWQWTGWNAIIFSAGISNIPQNLYEVAKLEGASDWNIFRYITFPLLKYSIAVVLVTTMINGLKAYDLIKVLTDGGPNHSSEFIATHIYNTAFKGLGRLGRACAMGYALTLLSAIFTIIYFKLNLKKETT